MAAPGSYPVELVGEFDERVNRFLWLIKWILIIPHAIVLSFISIPVIVTTPLSWLAVVIMGRYQEFLRGYHTGLLRWGWRVNFYCYEAGNTDKYPPFSFAFKDDYPADLIIDPPEIPSRLTAFFRWLLVLPHWVIVYFFLSTIRDILVLIALVVTLFTGRYPESLFDIIMGMNRWVYRVSAYSWLLVDAYPPFSFD